LTFLGIPSSPSTFSTDRVALLLPTSLCSSEIARLIAQNLNSELEVSPGQFCVTRFVALPHTEGCGMSSGSCEEIYRRTMLSHMLSPLVQYGLFLEHGCERTHNDYMSHYLQSEFGVDKSKFGWASIQADGGIEAVTKKVRSLFLSHVHRPLPTRVVTSLQHLRVALVTPPNMQPSQEGARALAFLARQLVDGGATIILAQNSLLTSSPVFLGEVLDPTQSLEMKPTVAYGQIPKNNGLHLMQTHTDNWVELLTGLGATGAEVMMVLVEGKYLMQPFASHPMIPLIRVANPTTSGSIPSTILAEYDLVLGQDFTQWVADIQQLLVDVCSGKQQVKQREGTDFQISRGPTGIST